MSVRIKKGVPIFVAIAVGVITLIGLLFSIPAINRITLGWGAMLATLALLLGVINLLTVHARRFVLARNLYSGVLVISMMAVFVAAIADELGVMQGSVAMIFNWVQVPLETAVASLLAFFLLFAAFSLLRWQRSVWSVLFMAAVLIVLLASLLPALAFVPDVVVTAVSRLQAIIQNVIATAGMRGLLIGIALGTITFGIRLLTGMERPYNK